MLSMHFRKFIKGFTALSLAVLCTVTTLGATITDVPSNKWSWAIESITELQDKGIMALSTSGQFFPAKTMDYFQVADVLARVAGYVDAELNPKADATLVAQIAANYEKQKPLLQSYASRYKTWNGAYNQQVAYLVGRGYMTTQDLDRFISKSGTKEVRNIVTKEELSVLLVRILGKAKTAEQTYQTTGFKDENTISQEARPYMAYLKELGVIGGDALGNANGKLKVTKALCAKMVYETLKVKEKLNPSTPSEEQVKPNEVEKEITVNKVFTKNATEFYVQVKIGEQLSYYAIKGTTKVVDETGKELQMTQLPGKTLKVTIEMQGGTEYITSAQYIGTITPGNLEQVEDEVTDQEEQETPNDNTNSNEQNKPNLSHQINGKIVDKRLTEEGLYLIVESGNQKLEISLGGDLQITRDTKVETIDALRVGDTVTITNDPTLGVKSLKAQGRKTKAAGIIRQIVIGESSHLVIESGDNKLTYPIASDVEIFDRVHLENLTLRDLHLGQTVELLLESEEIVYIEMQEEAYNVEVKAQIIGLDEDKKGIKVLIPEDALTGEKRVYRRIPLNDEVKIESKGKKKKRTDLKVGMQITLTYTYLEDSMPQVLSF